MIFMSLVMAIVFLTGAATKNDRAMRQHNVEEEQVESLEMNIEIPERLDHRRRQIRPNFVSENRVAVQDSLTGMDFNYLITRTNWIFSQNENQEIIVLRHPLHLYAYIESISQNGHFGMWDANGVPIKPDYLTGMEHEYTSEFFYEKYLLIVPLQAHSGSIRHEVERISEDGTIYVNRYSPMFMTMDMAGWTVILELPIEFEPKDAEYKVEFTDKELN